AQTQGRGGPVVHHSESSATSPARASLSLPTSSVPPKPEANLLKECGRPCDSRLQYLATIQVLRASGSLHTPWKQCSPRLWTVEELVIVIMESSCARADAIQPALILGVVPTTVRLTMSHRYLVSP